MKFQVSIRGLIQEARSKNFQFALGLMELIDNSVDEGATEVHVRADGDDLVVEDNGRGFGNIADAINYAMSPKPPGRIGRFGVGMKHMFMKFAHVFRAESCGKKLEVPVTDILDGTCDEEFSDPVSVELSPITRLTLEGCFELYGGRIDEQPICRAYEQLISDGSVRIYVNGKQLEPLPLPEFTSRIDESFEWRGRKVRLFGGVYHPSDEHARQWFGYNPYYNGRLIGRGRIANYGVGDEGCTNFAFLLHLDDGDERWQLATNKDAVDDIEDLLAYCYDHFTRPLLIEGAKQYRDIALQEQEDEITDLLNRKHRGPQKRKNKHLTEGTIDPTGCGKRKKRTFTSDGSDGEYDSGGDAQSRNRKFQFRYVSLGFDVQTDDTPMGRVRTVGRRVFIEANKDHPFMQANRASNAFVLLFAQMAYGIESNLKGNDFYSEEFAESLMQSIGYELAFYSGEECKLLRLADIQEAA